jgi:hypothetical protein
MILKDIWFEAEKVTEKISEGAPIHISETLKLFYKLAKYILLFIICSTIFVVLIGKQGIVILIGKIKERKNPVTKIEQEEYIEHSDFSLGEQGPIVPKEAEDPSAKMERLRRDGIL